MTKNTTRKGLAVGASLALISAGFAGALPASAAITTITLAPISGTSTTGILGADFIFTINPAGNAGNETLTLVLDDLTAAEVNSLEITSGSDISTAGAFSFSGAVEEVGNLTDHGSNGSTYVTFTPVAGNYTVIALDLKAASFTAAETVTVSVFEENSTPDGVYVAALDGKTSADFDITFIEASDVTATITAPTSASIGAKAMTSKVTLGNVNQRSINHASQLFKVGYSLDGAAAVDDSVVASDWSTTSSAFASTANSVAVASAGSVAFIRAYVLSETTAAATTSAATGDAGELDYLSAITAANGQDYKTTGDVIRSGAGSVDVTVTAKETDVNGDPVAGAVVTFKITEGSALKGTVSAGGKSVTNGSAVSSTENITYSVTTDADGVATLPITYTGLKASDNIVITASATGTSAVIAEASDLTLTAADSAAYLVGSTGGDSIEVVKGANASVAGHVVDQFGQGPAGTNRVKFTVSGGNLLASTVKYATVAADGSFSATWTDNSTAAGTATLTFNDVELLGTDGVTYSSASETAVDTVTVNVVTAATSAARMTFVKSATATEKDALATAAVKSWGRFDVNIAAPSALGDNSTLTATVYSSTGGPAEGVAVTFASANIQFEGTTQAVVEKGVGSWTGYTNASGQVEVEYTSNIAGAHVVTASAAGFSGTQTVTIAAAGEDAGTEWVIDAPSNVVAGGNAVFSATLVDVYGNSVTTASSSSVTLTHTGAGVLVGTNPADTDASGKVRISLWIGSNETGSAVLALTTTGQTAGAIKATHTITIGVAAADALATWTSNQNDGTVKMYAKNVVGAGKVQFMVNGVEIAWVRAASTSDSKLRLAGAEGAAYLVRTVELVEGQKNALEIYVDGVRLTRSAYAY